jgi:thiamine-monophosphate kinase
VEQELVEWLKTRFGDCRFARLGIGDDSAVLPSGDRDLVLTCDAICDGVHFDSTIHTAEQIGHKALAVNLSDLASMGATPRCATVSLVIPRSQSLQYVKRLYHGLAPLADRFQVDICGGDTTVWDSPLVISVSAVGTAPSGGPWRIDSARAGDRILVTGPLGGSILGHHLSFTPRCDFVEQWQDSGFVAACTDISDSLGADLAKIARASSVGFELQAGHVPIAAAAFQIAGGEAMNSALQHALCDGEDFELIVVARPDHAARLIEATDGLPHMTDIGVITAEQEFVIKVVNERRPFEPSGYVHRLNSAE